MDLSLLKALSEADAIASSEQEVRQILLEEADRLQKEVRVYRTSFLLYSAQEIRYSLHIVIR